MKRLEFEHLISELLDGSISEADFLRVEAELHVDAEARAYYYQMLMLDNGLSEIAGETDSFQVVEAGPKSRWWIPASIAAAITAMAAFVYLAPDGQETQLADISEVGAQASGFAVVTGQAGVEWENSDDIADYGLLPPGSHSLKAGLVQLELFSGVHVVIEGEAEFEILSPMEMRLKSGKMRASVPEPAHGFIVHTPNGEIVDLGTEFALDASEEGSELHVIDGEIEWHPDNAEMTLMEQGDALAWKDQQRSTPTTQASDFVGIAEFGNRLSASQEQRFRTWQTSLEKLRRDERLIANFDMDAAAAPARQIPSYSSLSSAGAVVAAKEVVDRWGHSSGAYDFSRTGSRLRVNVPGSHGSITFAAWVKINSLDREFNSLFLTEGHDKGEPHWQILSDGRMFFSVKKRDTFDDKHIFYSDSIWDPSKSGQWMHLATTYDLEANVVSHYVDGQRVARQDIPASYRVTDVRIGAASIGNWSEPPAYCKSDPSFAIRNLNGSIDDFFLFSGALSAVEIQSLYENAKP